MTSKIPHLSLNPCCETTILLIHGGLSSPSEYAFVTPHLQDYHLLIPALPSHALSSNSTCGCDTDAQPDKNNRIPFSLPVAAQLLADLIRSHSKSRKAHIAGLSLGGHLAIYLAAHHPDVVAGTVFASGFTDFSTWSTLSVKAAGYFFYLNNLPVKFLPRRASERMNKVLSNAAAPFPPGAYDEKVATCNLSLCHEICETLARDQKYDPVQARTLIVAATRKEITKFYFPDPVADASMVETRMKEGNPESRKARVPSCGHPWDVQDPELFAKGVRAWINGEPLPDGIEEF